MGGSFLFPYSYLSFWQGRIRCSSSFQQFVPMFRTVSRPWECPLINGGKAGWDFKKQKRNDLLSTITPHQALSVALCHKGFKHILFSNSTKTMKHTASVFPHIYAKCLASEASSVIGASKVESRIIRLILLIICKKLWSIYYSPLLHHIKHPKNPCATTGLRRSFLSTHSKKGIKKTARKNPYRSKMYRLIDCWCNRRFPQPNPSQLCAHSPARTHSL